MEKTYTLEELEAMDHAVMMAGINIKEHIVSMAKAHGAEKIVECIDHLGKVHDMLWEMIVPLKYPELRRS